MSFQPGHDTRTTLLDHHWVITLWGQKLVTPKHRQALVSQYADVKALAPAQALTHYMGTWQGEACFLVVFEPSHPIDFDASDFEISHLRQFLDVSPEDEFMMVGRALQLGYWLEQHQYCGRCGKTLHLADVERRLDCDACGNQVYPRISPCVIGLVKRGHQLLLAHNARFPEGRYSVLAGFIEPGESAEQAFSREVFEETAIEIKNITYFTSQPWPFPSQLMFGFIADYADGEIQVDGVEITHADWFETHNLPQLPPPGTISGKLIQWFIESQKTVDGALAEQRDEHEQRVNN